jgi:hypothetical protein
MPKGSFTDVRTFQVRVAGSRGAEYYVWMLGSYPRACSCPSFEHVKGPAGEDCKHMHARRGRRAIGFTRCARCPSWLTPEELASAAERQIPPGSITCSECDSDAPSSPFFEEPLT